MRVPLKPLLADAREQLDHAGIESPAFDADELMSAILGMRRTMLFMTDDVTEVQADAFRNLIARRARREPLQHITGRAGFRTMEMLVGKGVFIPRFETELVAGAAIDAAKALNAPVVVDLCAGSGAIACAVGSEVADAQVYAVERDPSAIYWLLCNTQRRVSLGDREITVVQSDIATCLPELDGCVDIVVSNPPYVPLSIREALSEEVSVFDPEVAVFSGEDGLELMPTVIATARKLLKPGGSFIVEHDDTHREAMLELLQDWDEVADHDDFNDRARFSTARKP